MSETEKTVLRAIGRGRRIASEISEKTGLSGSTVRRALGNLHGDGEIDELDFRETGIAGRPAREYARA